MPKKNEALQPEMTQIYQNEFMFGEGGGKGTSINSFLKSLSRSNTGRTTSSSSSNVKSVIADDPKVIGASFSHLNISSTQPLKKSPSSISQSGHSDKKKTERTRKTKHKAEKQHPFQSNIYMDSDDDWDASVDKSISDSKSSSLDISRKSGEIGLFPAANITSTSLSNTGIGSSVYSHDSPSSIIFQSQRNLQNSVTGIVKNSTDEDSDTDSDYSKQRQQCLKSPHCIQSNTENSILRHNYQKIIEDPIYILQIFQGPNISKYDENLIGTSGAQEEMNASIARFNRFKKVLLQEPNVNLDELRKLSWNGIPNELRAIVWQLLSGYLSTNADRRNISVQRKRKEYADQISNVMQGEKDTMTWHQITIDIPRTNPHIKLYSYPIIQRSLERILYLWAVRHPASGYVQGINDICTPFFQVYLSQYLENNKESCLDIGDLDPTSIPGEIFDIVEADTYWCLTKLLDSIQDNYIHAQPGIIRQVNELKDLTNRIDSELVKHLEAEGIEFLQFSFRWMNCLLMRELNMNHIVRMWDTYLTEGSSGFSEFHIYVCAAFLVKWSEKLKEMDFQEIMIFLQSLPTKNWGNKDIELLLSEAYMWQTLYKHATAHLR